MRKFLTYFVLIVCGLSMVIPFAWMLSTAVKSQLEINKGNIGFIPTESFMGYDDGEKVYKV